MLNNLRGGLRIEPLERVTSRSIERGWSCPIEKNGKAIEIAVMLWGKTHIFSKDMAKKVEEVYERMEPPVDIEEISIEGLSR